MMNTDWFVGQRVRHWSDDVKGTVTGFQRQDDRREILVHWDDELYPVAYKPHSLIPLDVVELIGELDKEALCS